MFTKFKDCGADPIGAGKFKMVPSGDIVDFEERNRRLPTKDAPQIDCLGMSWKQLAMMQGGLDSLDITRKEQNENKAGSKKNRKNGR